MSPARVLVSAWAIWALSWLAASVWTGRTANRVPRDSREVLFYRVLLLAGGVLFYHRTAEALDLPRLWHVGYGCAYALAGVTVAGFLFTWWARLHLGRLWSGSVELKQGHRVVDSGPYAMVRHPIYTGLLAAVIATAAVLATVPALLGAAFIGTGLWLKASIEERFLATELGPAAYDAYRRRVPMLIPFGPTAG